MATASEMVYEERIRDLRNRIDRCVQVIDGLKSSEWFRLVLEDLAAHAKQIDSVWHTIPVWGRKQLEELRVTKMAYKYLLDTLTTYEADLAQAKEELRRLENPQTVVHTDYDNE